MTVCRPAAIAAERVKSRPQRERAISRNKRPVVTFMQLQQRRQQKPWQPVLGSPSCRPCCTAPSVVAHGCGDPRASGHYVVLVPCMSFRIRVVFCLHAPNDLAVDGAGDAVLQLEVHLRHGVLGEDRGIGDITCAA